eukprot:gene6884-24205_t
MDPQQLHPVCTRTRAVSKTFGSSTLLASGSNERHLALYRNTEVNVTKIGSSNNAQLAIEATTLLKFSAHHPQHLLRMLGVVCSHPEGSSDGGRLLVSEHAPLGSLKSFFQYLDVDDFTVPFDHKAEILKQVGRGFACLAAEKIRVKNLSSESVMVFAFDLEDVAATRVKIADYGLNCVGSVDSKRFLSPETLQKGTFSEKTDVWSYGVLAWVLLTDGNRPYFMIPDDAAVFAHVLGGGRLPQPTTEECPNEQLWTAVASCYRCPKKLRPTFQQLMETIETATSSASAAAIACTPAPAVATQPTSPHEHERETPPLQHHPSTIIDDVFGHSLADSTPEPV